MPTAVSALRQATRSRAHCVRNARAYRALSPFGDIVQVNPELLDEQPVDSDVDGCPTEGFEMSGRACR
jgi:hypothetical protein